MVSVGTMFPIHSSRARHMVLAFGFAVTAALGAVSATLFAQAGSAPQAAAPPAGAHLALYVQIQSWHEAPQQPSAVRRLYLQTALVNSSRDSAAVPGVQDFTVRAADGRIWHVTPAGAPFSTLALQPGEQRGLSMFVDLPASASQLRLVMLHHGQADSIPLVS
jgi:hypothetical protein